MVRGNAAGDVLASLTTMVWNSPSKSWTGGATMADASLNRRMTVRLRDAVASAQIGVFGLDGQIELEALRLYGLLEAAPALLSGPPCFGNAVGRAMLEDTNEGDLMDFLRNPSSRDGLSGQRASW